MDKSGVKGLRRSIVDQEIKTSKRRTGPAAAEAQFLALGPAHTPPGSSLSLGPDQWPNGQNRPASFPKPTSLPFLLFFPFLPLTRGPGPLRSSAAEPRPVLFLFLFLSFLPLGQSILLSLFSSPLPLPQLSPPSPFHLIDHV